MSEVWAYKLAVLGTLLCVGVLTAAIVVLFRWLVWWPTLLLQIPYRPGLVFTRMALVLAAAAIVPVVALPMGSGVAVMILLWLTIVPGVAERWTRAAAWKSDQPADRSDAALIRRAIMERRGDTSHFDGTKPWPSYIVDMARVQRRRRYRPPGL